MIYTHIANIILCVLNLIRFVLIYFLLLFTSLIVEFIVHTFMCHFLDFVSALFVVTVVSVVTAVAVFTAVTVYDISVVFVSGDIRVSSRLDRERISSYRLTGVATDGSGLSCTSDILVELTDINDNNPVFDQTSYTYTLPEDSINNTLLLRVTATDKDQGMCHSYSIYRKSPTRSRGI